MTEARPLSRLIPRDHSPVRLAVAGLGSMGKIHLKAAAFLQAGVSEDYYKADLARQIRRLTLCAVCDSNPEKQDEFPTHPFYQSWGDLLRNQKPHLAIYFFGPLSRTETLSCRRVNGRIMEIEIQLEHVAGTSGQLFVSWLVGAKGAKRRQVRMQSAHGEKISGDFVEKSLSIAGVEVTCGVQGWIAPVNNQIKDQLADFLAYCLEPDPGMPPPLLSREEMLESIHIIEHIRSQSTHV